MSDISSDSVQSLDFLGFKIDTFIRTASDDINSSVNSMYFPHPNEAEAAEIEQYIAAKGYKILLKYDSNGSFLQIPTKVHESPPQYLSHVVNVNNMQRTMNVIYPVQVLGTADVIVNGVICQPDFQSQVGERTHPSPNMVVETYYRNSYTMAQFHGRLLSYITDTPDVMIVLGFRVFGRNPQGTFEAVVIVYERTAANQPAIAYNISFGTAPISHVHATGWINGAQVALNAIMAGAIVPPLVGVGLGSPPCTQATGGAPPYVIRLRQELMLCRNFAVPFMFHPGNLGPIAGLDFDINLFFIQFAMDRVL